MAEDFDPGRLAHIPTERIRSNPDNPRLTFRQSELEGLQESIRQYGIQVPVSVFKRGAEYILIDGERRWRCASKLNLKTIPALVQSEPRPLENLLLMFNIHALREQWDLMTIALKLPKGVSLMKRELKREPKEVELTARTGLSRSVIRRCRLLMDLPPDHRDRLLDELKKPKSQQALSEDLYIELEKSLKTVARAMPEVLPDRDAARDALVEKYLSKVITNIVDFRKMAKIARSDSVGVDRQTARQALNRILTEPEYPITTAWEETVSEAYAERDIVSRVDTLLDKLRDLQPGEIDDDVREKLEELIDRAASLLEADT